MPRRVDHPRMLILAEGSGEDGIADHVESEGLAAVEVEGDPETAYDRLGESDFDCVAIGHEVGETSGPEALLSVRDEHPELPVALFGERVGDRGGGVQQAGEVTGDLTEYVSGDDPQELGAGIETVLHAWIDSERVPEPVGDESETVEETGTSVLFEQSPDPIAEYRFEDGEPVIEAVNAAFEDTFGCTADRVVGDTLDEVVLTVGHGQGHANLLDPETAVETELRCRTIEGVRVFLLRSTGVENGNDYVVYTEISDYKSVEQRYVSLVKSSSDVLMILDRDGTVTYVSPALEDAFGYPPADLEGESILDWIHPEDCDMVVERLFEDPMEWAGETRSVTYRFQNDQGEWRVVESAAKSRLYDPAVEGIVINCRDVTQRERREAELERFETIAKTVPVGVVVLDREDHIEWINDHALEMLGNERAAIEGLTARQLVEHGYIEPSLIERFTASVKQLRETDAQTTRVEETSVTTPDNERKIVDLHLGLLEGDDGYQGIVAAIRDVTDRKEYERKLAALHEAGRDLMDAETEREVAEVGIAAAKEILGIQIGGVHLVDEDETVLEPVAATEDAREEFGEIPTLERGESLAWDAYDAGDSVVYDDLPDSEDVANPDTPLQSELHIPLDDHGVLLVGSMTSDSFTETDRSLAQVLAANMQAALTRAQRETDLREQRREVERQNERLEEFASFVSHDLRNPLNVAEGYLEAAMATGDEHHLEEIQYSLDRMEQLIEELLTLARQGDAIGDLEPVFLESVCEDAWSTVETEDVELTVEESAVIQADRTRLRQLLENLIRNVLEHGVTDDPDEEDATRIWVGVDEAGFYFEDDGRGIPESERDQIFETGYTTQEEGTGFGLGIVSQVVDAHDWEIAVTEGRDGGARFEVTGVDVE